MDAALDAVIGKVRQAAARARPLRIRGGGSKDFYGQRLHGELLDVRPLAGVVDYEPSELVVTVRAGTRLRELQALLAERGQCLPFEPPQFGVGSTIGGAVAAGLSGPARASVFLNLNPVFGPALAVLLLGEPLKPYHLLALAMVLGGIWIAERLGARPSLQNK